MTYTLLVRKLNCTNYFCTLGHIIWFYLKLSPSLKCYRDLLHACQGPELDIKLITVFEVKLSKYPWHLGLTSGKSSWDGPIFYSKSSNSMDSNSAMDVTSKIARFLAIAWILTQILVHIQIAPFQIAQCIFWTKMYAIRGLTVLLLRLMMSHFGPNLDLCEQLGKAHD